MNLTQKSTFLGFVGLLSLSASPAFSQPSVPSPEELEQRREAIRESREGFLESSKKARELEEELQKAKEAGDQEAVKKIKENLTTVQKKQTETYQHLKETGVERRALNKSKGRELNQELRRMKAKIGEKADGTEGSEEELEQAEPAPAPDTE